jgi:serine/threonine protein kinase
MEGASKLAYSTNSAHGTDCYRAPEMIFRNPVVSMKSDIWALGCVAYELLSGRQVFPHEAMVWEYRFVAGTELDAPPLLDTLTEQSKAYITLLVKSMLARLECWNRPSAQDVLDLLNSMAAEPCQVYLGVKGNGFGQVLIHRDNKCWRNVLWKRYWFLTIIKALTLVFNASQRSRPPLRIRKWIVPRCRRRMSVLALI